MKGDIKINGTQGEFLLYPNHRPIFHLFSSLLSHLTFIHVVYDTA